MSRCIRDSAAVANETSTMPGLTSLVRTGRGLMTVQTEIVGQPATLVTIVDFRGRVLKTWRSSFAVDEQDPALGDIARKWHADIEASVRETLKRAVTRQRGDDEQQLAVSHLFLSAARAYAERDFETALALLGACELLLPDDPRIRAAIRRIRPKT
jgi:hypothetical protein